MEPSRTNPTLELLERAQQRALAGLQRDLASLRAELSAEGASGKLVRRHPLLALAAATTAGVGLGLLARAGLRSRARVLRAASRALPARRVRLRL
jgi:hypothetical protein